MNLERFKKLRADAFVEKPIDAPHLLEVLNKLTDQDQATAQA